jgi:peptidoglycan/LPS O-acetylase OafA/YrhL
LSARAVTHAAAVGSRIPALDGLRAVASLTVVFYHFGPHIATDWSSPFSRLQRLPRLGEEGVTLFFVLSGFLISSILVNARSSPRYFGTFYIRRIFRIFPLYYAVLLGYVAMLAVVGPRTTLMPRLLEPRLPLWPFFVYVQNFAMALAAGYGGTWMAGSWSLAVEEQFYLTLPAVVRVTTDRGLAIAAAAAFLLPIPLRAAIQHFAFVPQLSNKILLPTTVDALAAGVLVMLALRYYRPWILDRRSLVGWATLVALAAWFGWPGLFEISHVRYLFLDSTLTSVVCAFALTYVLVAPDSGFGRFLSLSRMRTLGNMAYSTYLLHPILLCVCFWLLRHEDPLLRTAADLIPVACALGLTLAASYLSWAGLESRLLKVGHRWRY